jgi:hypothetical protein
METGMKITQEWIDETLSEAIARFHHFPDTTTTICLLTLENGFSLVGQSSCIHKKDFDSALGMKLAIENAREQLWELEGYHRMASRIQESSA